MTDSIEQSKITNGLIVRRETIKEAVAVCENWLEVYGATNPQHITPQDWACDAIRDIADAIRALPVNDK